ncbi:MAG: glycosyltransferase family 1 protein [Sphingomicrobium sp.]
MTVFINGRFLLQPLSGVQRYAREMVRALDALASRGEASEMLLLCPPGAPRLGLNYIEQRTVGGGAGHGWEQWAFARAARGGVALSLAMSGPLLHRRQLVVIHDAAVHRCPTHFSRRYVTGHRLLERGLARRARIATVSQFSRRELAAVLGLAERDILVASNGADHARGVRDTAVLRRLGVDGQPFFLTVGNQSPNKNLAVVARALALIDDPAVRLVVVGEPLARVFGEATIAADPRSIIAGRLTDAEVAGLFGAARALVFPSRYEGFGLPPLEAMASGCPVLASDCAAVLEVCGDAGDHFGPDDAEALARLMRRALADDGQWREARIAAGHQRAAKYRWADSAAVLAQACAAIGRDRVLAA